MACVAGSTCVVPHFGLSVLVGIRVRDLGHVAPSYQDSCAIETGWGTYVFESGTLVVTHSRHSQYSNMKTD